MRAPRSLLALTLVLAACGSDGKGGNNPNKDAGDCPGGIDFDGDGYGYGCAAGEDCNDADAKFNVDCCFGGNVYTGCACDSAANQQPVSCFDGDPALAGVGACVVGERTCIEATNTWSACEGSVVPKYEVCDDGGDNDCDGQADEGVLTACGNCMPGCDQNAIGDGMPFPTEDDDPNVDMDGVGLDPSGDLVLDSSKIEAYFLWIANDAEGTVSKIDTRTFKEVARYASVTHSFGRLVLPTKPAGGNWTEWDGSVAPWDRDDRKEGDASVVSNGLADNRPSRTAIDFDGNCWVANRAHDDNLNLAYQPSATKIWNDVEDCFDFNGNGKIDTSTDVNGDGRIDLAATGVDQEFFAEDDECIAATVKIGTLNGKARAVAIDAGAYNIDYGGYNPGDPGRPWVGLHGDGAFVRIDLAGTKAAPSAVATRVPETGTLPSARGGSNYHQPYGAAIDSRGYVWSVNGCCDFDPELIAIDTATNTLVEQRDGTGAPIPGDYVHTLTGASGEGSYGLVVDLNDKPWVAGIYGHEIVRYDPDDGSSMAYPITAGGTYYRTRGMAIDGKGYVWAAIDRDKADSNLRSGTAVTAKVARLPADGLGSMEVYDMANGGQGQHPVGVGVDFDGHVWTVNQNSSNLSRLYIDPNTASPADDPDPGINQVTIVNYDSVNGNGTKPYTYSDFTGLSLRLVTRPSGDYAAVLQGCPGGSEAVWSAVVFDATVPLNTKVEVFVQVGNDLATLDQQPYYGPWTASPADLTMAPGPVPNGVYLRVTLRLISEDRATSPIVKSYSVQYTCPSEGIR